MGLITNLVYLDSCLVIYLVEENQAFAPSLETSISSLSNVNLVVSDLTMMECLVMPIRNNNQLLIDKFTGWFEQVNVFSLSKQIFHHAAKLRADHSSLKTPDALHLATAIHHNCDEFWTNDNRLNKIAPSMVKDVFHS